MKKKMTMKQKVMSLLAMSLTITLLAATMGFTTSAKTVSENAMQAGKGTPTNPVHQCTKENDGTDTTTWSYVYFGSYPQSEVTDTATIAAIDSAISAGNSTKSDVGTDVWVDGVKYRRISKSDTNYDLYFDDVYVGNSGYRYFKWERIKWKVLANDGNTLFVIADNLLDSKFYCDDYEFSTWESSDVRSWLNSSFYNTAFSSSEQSAIVAQNVVTEDNPAYDTDCGNNTIDKVYLLSIAEATNESYGFCTDHTVYSLSRRTQVSAYANARGVFKFETGEYEGKGMWWLRSSGISNFSASYAGYDGHIDRAGTTVNYTRMGVAPVLHVNLNSDKWTMVDDGTSGDGGSHNEMTERVQAPKVNIPGGTYNTAQNVTLSTQTAGAEIYHTTDGSTPSKTNGTKYTTSITISNSLTLKAIAVKAGMYDSDIMTVQYTISATSDGKQQESNPSVEEVEKKITATNTDKGDVSGAKFSSLRLKATGKNKSIKLTWSKVKDADGYIIYGAKCGKSMKKIKTLKGNKKVSYTQKKLKKGKYYKYMVVAYKNVNGKKCTIATSKSAHAVTNGGKYGNPTKVSVKSSKMTIKKGRTKTIKASYTLPKGKKASIHIAKFRYESSNTKIATVSKKGVVKGKAKGTAYIYVYAQNGVYKKVKVTVK